MEQLTAMQHNIERARKADLKVNIHKMEVCFLLVFLFFSGS